VILQTEPAPDSLEAAPQWYGVTSTSRRRPRQSNTKRPRERSRLRLFVTKLQSVSRKEDSPLLAATSVSSTSAALPSRRLRFELFDDNRWRREETPSQDFHGEVILKAFSPLICAFWLRAMGFGNRQKVNSGSRNDKRFIMVRLHQPQMLSGVQRIEPAGSPKGHSLAASESNVVQICRMQSPARNSRR